MTTAGVVKRDIKSFDYSSIWKLIDIVSYRDYRGTYRDDTPIM